MAPMSDARTNYQKALGAYAEAQADASKKVKMIEKVGSVLNSTRELPSFFGWQYSVRLPMMYERYLDSARFDMNQWPDAADLKSVLTDWSTAFDQLHAAWNAMTPAERVGFVEPPKWLATK